MKELPWFKFYPNQWLTGSISFMKLDQQGAFLKVCLYYWSKECNITLEQIKTLIPSQWKALIDANLLKIENDNIKIKWLYEQHQERLKEHNRNVVSGRKGGLSRAKALRKEKIRKEKIDKYAKDNFLKISPELRKLLDK